MLESERWFSKFSVLNVSNYNWTSIAREDLDEPFENEAQIFAEADTAVSVSQVVGRCGPIVIR
jgi:hypothetical protein